MTENRSNGGPAVYDKNRREIRRGDILKVFHFTGPRRKRFFMYKQAMGMVMLGAKDPSPYMFLDHLDLKGDGYHEPMDGRVLSEAEIVQGCEAFWETSRPLATRSSSKEA